jgi:hypothetical protein
MSVALEHHPLFDANGLYRFCTRHTLGADQGHEYVKRFFSDLRHERLLDRAEQGDLPPSEAWGYSPDLNETISRFLMLERHLQSKVQKPRAQELESGAEEPELHTAAYGPGATPAIAVVDLEPVAQAIDAGTAELPRLQWRRSPGLFSGCGDDIAGAREASQFRIDVPGLPVHRRCLFLILRRPLLKHMRGMLDAPEDFFRTSPSGFALAQLPPGNVRNDSEAEQTLIAKLNLFHEYSGTAAADSMANPRYREVVRLLAQAPALEGHTHMVLDNPDDTRFEMTVPLDQPCPLLSGAVWCVLVLGPTEVKANGAGG